MNIQKEFLRTSYGQTAQEYTKKTDGIILYDLIDRFCTLVPQGHIVDIGCGAGRDLCIFESRGYQVTGLEITPELARIARSRINSNVLLEDIVDDHISLEKVDGIWSIGTYHHFPRRSILKTTKKMKNLLKDGGTILVSTKRGCGEKVFPDERYGGVKKYWSFFEPVELKKIYLQAGFKDIVVKEDDDVWLTLIAHS